MNLSWKGVSGMLKPLMINIISFIILGVTDKYVMKHIIHDIVVIILLI